MENRAPPRIFDQSRRGLRYERAMRRQRGPNPATFLADDMTDEIVERVKFMQLAPAPAFILGETTNRLAPLLGDYGLSTWENGPHGVDEEQPLPDAFFRYIFSLTTLDTINDLPGALRHMRHALPAGGLYIGQMMGAGSLPIMRAVMLAADGDRPEARIHPQVDSPSAAALMQRAGFSKQVVDSRSLRVSYRSFDQLISDLRDQGQTGVLADRPSAITKVSRRRALGAFEELRGDNGRVVETFEILTLTGWVN